jgi:predicted Fe-S protein YdhL (DUF1289 family)
MSAPQSPCTGVCTLNREHVCVGCGRTLDEIATWAAASDARREQIVKAARERRAHLKKKPQ